ncbi:MAG TPA: diaminopimelate epimerase [Methanocella sp.]|nr:diaminopimelate epimerase [Methanocella sp.]
MTQIKFTKMHGNGNDFIMIDELQCPVPEEKKSAFTRKYCHRRFGIGADGVLFLAKPLHTALHMRIFNEDGGEAEMCGNGLRCFVKYAMDNGHMRPGTAKVETKAGTLDVEAKVGEDGKTMVKIAMGKPLFDPKKIPSSGLNNFINMPMHGYEVSAVNTGVPHAVIFVDDLQAVDIMKDAPPIRNDFKAFPKGANVNFVHREGTNLRVRTFERGVEGETLSCGTGSVAAAAVARHIGYIRDETTVYTTGGALKISFLHDIAHMEGPAETVFDGQVDVDFAAL